MWGRLQHPLTEAGAGHGLWRRADRESLGLNGPKDGEVSKCDAASMSIFALMHEWTIATSSLFAARSNCVTASCSFVSVSVMAQPTRFAPLTLPERQLSSCSMTALRESIRRVRVASAQSRSNGPTSGSLCPSQSTLDTAPYFSSTNPSRVKPRPFLHPNRPSLLIDLKPS